ncbi:hypothetical protein DUNSADRAFT_13974 [Dunaliella salina]|uniref:DUF202 domain-containing protein n=1 Tax=Dunaliella salina TaxID=3046 RepID=A0ABQ7G897_DUNSA|nr:hypothetical protein DUNSADRAFT_13974 [Dunaliella salina]|eukprot:KAF5830826.1 hypothetical protein DUNSADRAFT_13974 [Dunaliella salina]
MTTELRRTDAKAFFANERTFLHWMNTSVTIGSIAAALSGIAGHAHRNWGNDYIERAVVTRAVSLTMLAMAILMAIWAGYNFHRRNIFLEAKLDGPYDSRALPIMLAGLLLLSLGVVFSGALIRLMDQGVF